MEGREEGAGGEGMERGRQERSKGREEVGKRKGEVRGGGGREGGYDQEMGVGGDAVSYSVPTLREQRQLLMKCATTAMSSKLIARQRDFFSVMVVDAVMMLDNLLPLNMIGMKKVKGGSLEVSCLITAAWLYSMFMYSSVKFTFRFRSTIVVRCAQKIRKPCRLNRV